MNRSSSTYSKTSSNISSYGDPDHPSFTDEESSGEAFDRRLCESKSSEHYVFFLESTFTGKETDCETGFSYFGARYYDPTLLTSWTAIDPMSDKYPRLSPYNYCAWNPMKVIDPNGCDTFNIDISHGRIYWQPADGNHSIKFCIIGKQNKLEELEELRIEDIPMESLSLDFDLSENFTTTYLKFSDDILGYSVFNTTITLSDKYMGKMQWSGTIIPCKVAVGKSPHQGNLVECTMRQTDIPTTMLVVGNTTIPTVNTILRMLTNLWQRN